VTKLGVDDGSMVTSNTSFPSQMLSSFIGTSKGTLVCPAVNVTVYGPES